MNENVSIILHTCDSYEFCWDGFLHYFKKNFQIDNIKKYFCNEEKKINLDKKKFDIFIFHSSLTKEGNIKKLIDSSAVKSLRLPKNFNDKIFAISNEKLDIIFYPDIGMSSDLYYLTFLKLAPIQMSAQATSPLLAFLD